MQGLKESISDKLSIDPGDAKSGFRSVVTHALAAAPGRVAIHVLAALLLVEYTGIRGGFATEFCVCGPFSFASGNSGAIRFIGPTLFSMSECSGCIALIAFT